MSVKKFINLINSLDRSKSTTEHFDSFLTLAYRAYAEATSTSERAEVLEAEYIRVVGTYADKNDVRKMPELIAMVFEGVHAGMDFLGAVLSEMGALDARRSQFFTPYEVSRLMAEINLTNIGQIIEEKRLLHNLEARVWGWRYVAFRCRCFGSFRF